MEEKETKG